MVSSSSLISPLTSLSGGVDDDDAHDVVEITLDACCVLTVSLVRSLDGVGGPVGPVDVVLVLRQAERVLQVLTDHLQVTTYKNIDYFVGCY